MNYKEILKNNFGEQILDAFLQKEDGMKKLVVIVEKHDFDEISKISYEINDFIDKSIPNTEFDFVAVESKGIQNELKYEDLSSNLEKEFELSLFKNENKKDFYIGKIIEINDDFLIIKWNNRGRFQKQKIEKTNIKKIQEHIKF
ncbi:ribosome assembly cofactor RimP [Mycoplasmopsis hyopharyngis]|uniref:ribosome assembly cofactor RimP n=1 Tax=Mycoplasmopsis hyopharyngis TaxID=29558 RepID=UPI003873734D